MAVAADLDRIVAGVDKKQSIIAYPKTYFFGTAL
jgi:hypothetical protein